MIRSRLMVLKPFFFAILALVMTVCACEMGLRIHVAATGKLPVVAEPEDELLVKSWKTHHSLRPLKSVSLPHPDTGEPIALRTNSFGLRGPEPSVPKHPGTFRILCLGDENVLAPGISEEATFCVQLQQLLQGESRLEIEVINAGVPEYCPVLCLLQVRHLLLSLQPDVLLLNLDMAHIAADYRCRRHVQFDREGIPLACPHPELSSRKFSSGSRMGDHFLIFRWGQRQLGEVAVDRTSDDTREIHALEGRYAWLRDDPPDWSIHIEQALSPLELFARLANRIHAHLLIATYPVPWQVSATASSGAGVREAAGVPPETVFTSREPFDRLAEAASRWGIPFCDSSGAFHRQADPDSLYLHNAPRFSEAGHRLYAEVLAHFIVQQVPGLWGRNSLDGSAPRPLQPGTHRQAVFERTPP